MKKFKKFIKQLRLIDYLIGGVILVILGFVILFLRRGNTFIEITLKVTDTDVISANARPVNQYALSFVKGDAERNELGQAISTIEDITTIRSNPENQVMYLKLKVKALYSPLKKQYSLKGKPVVFGQGYSFTFSNVKFEGIVVNFPGYQMSEEMTEDTVNIKAQLKEDNRSFSDVYGVLPYVAKALKAGDEVKDSYGAVVAKIIEVTEKPAKRTVVANDGSIRVIDDPQLKDVFYTIQLKIKKTATKTYFLDFVPLEIGSSVPLVFPHISLYPTVTEILE